MKYTLAIFIYALSLSANALNIIQPSDSNISEDALIFLSKSLVSECPQMTTETLFLSVDQYVQNKVGSDPGMVDRYWQLSLVNKLQNIQVKATLVDQFAVNLKVDQIQILGLTCHRYGIHD